MCQNKKSFPGKVQAELQMSLATHIAYSINHWGGSISVCGDFYEVWTGG